MAWVVNHTTGVATDSSTGATFQAAPPAYSTPTYTAPSTPTYSAPAPTYSAPTYSS